ARNVPAAPGKHIRPRMGGWRHLPRCLPPERGRAVEVQFRARQYRDAVRALPPVRSRGQAPDRRAVRSSGLRDGAQVLAYLQPARCARRDLGDRASRLHRPRARTCPSGRQSLLRLARAAGFSPGEAPAPEAPEEKGASIMPERKSARAPAVATLLVEVLTEELPPKALKRLSEAFAEVLAADLRHEDFLTAESNVRVYATPRRLAVQIAAVRSRAPDKAVGFSGPSVKVGLDAEGKPTPALLGFARKQGVDVARLERRDTAKGEAFFYRTMAAGGALETNLDLKVGFALEKLPVPKIMRWGAGDSKFVRPVHGLVMMHGARVVRGEVMDVKSSNRTLGHRVLARNPVRLRHAEDYERTLQEQGRVIPDFAKRRAEIELQLRKSAGRAAALVAGGALLDEITALVESPATHAGKFSPDFLEVPQECLILSMQQHQRYVPLHHPESGELLPRFLFVANGRTDNPRTVVHGNERVLRARLADAKFFYDQDRKTRLEARVPRLASVVYHNKLGSQLERVERVKLLAGKIARHLRADFLRAERAAWLSKADLLTDMVGEFPELQGVMGRYYALHDGEPEEIADAIEGHYYPRFAGDELPSAPVAVAVALAD